jgi:MEMO1 family protein
MSRGRADAAQSRRRRPRVAAVALAAAASWAALTGCRPAPREYSTWASLGEEPAKAALPEPEALPPQGAVPWAGTVSHHLLADGLIDRWFAELASRRKVETFYVLTPSHWNLVPMGCAVTDGRWRVAGGFVESDRAKAAALARTLGAARGEALEPAVFDGEHGASTLMPYIARHFPRARVVAVAYRGEPPLDQPMAESLARALAPAFSNNGKAHSFLLVSADFAHHGDREGTAVKDARTRRFFEAPSTGTWISAGCDNRPGIYAIARLAGSGARAAVLFHSDSLALSGRDPGDITSYFFSFLWD